MYDHDTRIPHIKQCHCQPLNLYKLLISKSPIKIKFISLFDYHNNNVKNMSLQLNFQTKSKKKNSELPATSVTFISIHQYVWSSNSQNPPWALQGTAFLLDW